MHVFEKMKKLNNLNGFKQSNILFEMYAAKVEFILLNCRYLLY